MPAHEAATTGVLHREHGALGIGQAASVVAEFELAAVPVHVRLAEVEIAFAQAS